MWQDKNARKEYSSEENYQGSSQQKCYIVRLANSKARIKPTAPLSAFDKENSIEFPLDFVYYLYKQSNLNPVLLSCAFL